MKVEINGKTYCVETLIADNERLRKDVIASADTNRLVLDSVQAEIEQELKDESEHPYGQGLKRAIEIIDKYKAESEEI
jgi:hypothetical protein